MATYLDRILAAHRAAARADDRPLRAAGRRGPGPSVPRGFAAALRAGRAASAVIAEIKRRSPSRGDLAADLDPAELARRLRAGRGGLPVGADRSRVLRRVARRPAGRPGRDRAPGAAQGLHRRRPPTCATPASWAPTRVLLIAAALDDDELGELHTPGRRRRARRAGRGPRRGGARPGAGVGAALVGVNQRDLVTFEVDHDRAARVGEAMPATVVRVAESGIRGPDDARRPGRCGLRRRAGGRVAGDRRRSRRQRACAALPDVRRLRRTTAATPARSAYAVGSARTASTATSLPRLSVADRRARVDPLYQLEGDAFGTLEEPRAAG